MHTISHNTHRIKVVATLPGNRKAILIDDTLDASTLPLLQPVSELSRAILNGAGYAHSPRCITVYIDDVKRWAKRASRVANTATEPLTRPMHEELSIPCLTDAIGDHDYNDERLADNRAAWESLTSDRHYRDEWPDRVAEDLIDAIGSQRPRITPAGRSTAWYSERQYSEG